MASPNNSLMAIREADKNPGEWVLMSSFKTVGELRRYLVQFGAKMPIEFIGQRRQSLYYKFENHEARLGFK